MAGSEVGASPQSQDGPDFSTIVAAPSHVSDTDPAGPLSSTSLKRKRLTSDAFTRRKRATTACQFCRLRKTKCDNARPICGFCQYHKAKCVYGESDPFEGEDGQSSKGSGAEQQREIIDRLDEIKELLLSQQSNRNDASETYTAGASEHLQAQAPISVDGAVTPATTVPVDPDFPSTSPNSTPRPLAATRGETLLRWPVFDNVVGDEDRAIESFALETETETETEMNGSQQRPQPSAIPEDGFVPLCQKFLQHVHLRNPILDGENLSAYAKHVTEFGLSWDAPSCLVPWKFSPPASLDNVDSGVAHSKPTDEEGLATAESYYSAAKKRIGLLGSSILDMQCFFVASIYEKCCLRPLQAWFYIQQVCTRLQTHLLRKGKASRIADSGSGVEARLFWSCIRAEGEIAAGTGLRPSGLDEFMYPELFPQPPASLKYSESLGPNHDGDLTDQERSWYFYMAEISVWRMINGTSWLLYRKGEAHWLKDIDDVLRHCEDSQTQISMWYNHLPASLKFDGTQRRQNELAVYLQGRFYNWRMLILRPIVYYALHRPREQRLGSSVLTLAQECIDLCSNSILRNVSHHRHGGTWFALRSMFTSAMLILAVVCKARDGGELLPPPQWQKLIKAALATMEKWERQAPDVERMRRTLGRVFSDVWRRTGLAVADLVDADASLDSERVHYKAPLWPFMES
ncbi:hypothetical protein VMCG_03099 [Cytospora schulzeri]|uniref:Zn(2)-C6 fungal-type domain-containing protein n=1 Tax=Cytospora schulzeri TaxID=448051 RepID=A0A423WXY9_9PEZI|nr:hypothetical protein VMCG_03099 [Valsa malicola]